MYPNDAVANARLSFGKATAMLLIIEEGDEVVLSPEFHRLHNICVVLHDQVAFLLGHEVYDLFQQAPEGEASIDVLARDITQALVSDFLHFVYESLAAAKKGKMTVAYTLLRKPFTDLLLLLEQLLYDRHEFVLRFTQEQPVKYDPSFADLDKQAIISRSCSKLPLLEILDEKFIHALRYDKSSTIGVGGSSTQALHIVTRGKHHTTPSAYFNFVFDAVDSLDKYWTNYYHVVPYLLCYAASVIDEIAFDYMPDLLHVKHLKNIQRFLFISEIHVDHVAPKTTPEQETLYEYLATALAHTCKECGHDITFTQADHKLLLRDVVMLCPVCAHNQLLDVDFDIKFHYAWEALVPM